MGILFKILKLSNEEENVPRIFVNFENVQPTDSELSLYEKCAQITKEIESTLEMMKNYGGVAEAIRKAIASPKDVEIQENVWVALQPQMIKLKHFYTYSQQLSSIFPTILQTLSNGGDFVNTITQNPASTKQMALILDFTFKFDEMKTANPAVQNDLSFYRRLLSQTKSNVSDDDLIIKREEANKISIFFACPTPFLTALINSISKTNNGSATDANRAITHCFSIMIKLCRFMLDDPQLSVNFTDNETKIFVLRFMVGLIILFDHVDESGSFHRSSGFDVKLCIKTLKEFSLCDTSNLVNALKFTSKHLHDESTPHSIRDMLET